MSLFSTSMDYGLDWPVWLAAGGALLFCLLAVYAAGLLVAGKRPSDRFRFLQLPTLRGRMMLALTFAATLPAISLALVLSERIAQPIDHLLVLYVLVGQRLVRGDDRVETRRVPVHVRVDGAVERHSRCQRRTLYCY